MRRTSWALIALGTLALTGPALAQSYPDKDPSSAYPRGNDGITEMQREQRRQGAPYVPMQNREARQGDAMEHRGETTREWLKEAQEAVARGQLGQANEYLERAATRILSRSTEPHRAGELMQDQRLGHINVAREALMRRDRRRAAREIDLAIASR